MLKVLCLFFCIISLLSYGQSPVKMHGFLSVKKKVLLDEHGNKIALHGVSYGWNNYWPRFYNPASVKWLADDWGVSVVRAAIGAEPKGGYIDDPKKAVEASDAIIKGAIESGIYVIVDWHSHNINLDSAAQFFTLIAKKYHRYPNIIYEIFNEPDYESWHDVKLYAQKIISTIRKYDEKNLILVGCPHWDQDINLPAADPLRNVSNVMYTIHFYAATHKQALRSRCDSALATGIPIFISESAGMEASGNGKINYAEWQNWIHWADSRNISWVVWDIADKDETCSMLKKTANSYGGWKDTDLKESGIYTKELLKKY